MKRKMKSATLLTGALLVGTMGAMAAQGELRAYYANDPANRNVVSIESRAPLETMLTRTGAIIGEIHVNPENVLDKPSAKFSIDLNTLETGISKRDEHMKSEGWLDTAKFPTATFELDSASAKVISPAKDGPTAFLPYKLSDKGLAISGSGAMTLHGVTKTIPVFVSVDSVAATDNTKSRLPGDILHTRATFTIKLSDFGINVPAMAQAKVADEQTVTADIFTSTDSPKPDDVPAAK